MKKNIFLFSTLFLTLFSCSLKDEQPENEEIPEFAMTAKINGNLFQANNPFGNNQFSSTNIWDYYPKSDFVMLQGRTGGVLGTPEINIWLKKSDIVVGTYQIGQETYTTPPSHFIDLNDTSNDEFEVTKEGKIVITKIDSTLKIVTGAFEFITTKGEGSSTITFRVTEGKFRYKYE